MLILSWPGASYDSNPYVPLLCAALGDQGATVMEFTPRRALRARADVIHVHWTEQVIWHRSSTRAIAAYAVKVLLALAIAKARGATIVWTVHNLRPHETSQREGSIVAAFSACLAFLVDGFITLSPSTVSEVRAAISGLRNKPNCAIAHGEYRSAFPPPPGREEARTLLSLPRESRVLLHVGSLRAYKRLDSLVNAFASLTEASDVLVLAGEPHDHSVVESISTDDPRIVRRLGFQSDVDVVRLLAASDVLVHPAGEVLFSSTVLLGLSFARPVLARRSPYASDIEARVGSDWLFLYDSDLDAATLAAAIDWATIGYRPAQPDLSWCQWPAIARETLRFYDSLGARGTRELLR